MAEIPDFDIHPVRRASEPDFDINLVAREPEDLLSAPDFELSSVPITPGQVGLVVDTDFDLYPVRRETPTIVDFGIQLRPRDSS